MRSLVKFLRRPGPEKNLLLKAALAVFIFRILGWLFPTFPLRFLRSESKAGFLKFAPKEKGDRFLNLSPFSFKPGTLSSGFPPKASPAQIDWAVKTVTRFIPGAGRCLTQAMITQLWLRKERCDSSIRLGVAKNTDGKLRAHAWVETGGQTEK